MLRKPALYLIMFPRYSRNEAGACGVAILGDAAAWASVITEESSLFILTA
jgi:hypothetical protein